MLIVVDPGHQLVPDLAPEPLAPGSTATKPRCASGTWGARTGVPEHAVNLEFSLRLAHRLREAGFSTTLTRTTPEARVSNAQRAVLANELGARAVVHVHCNGVRRRLRRIGAFRSGSMTIAPGVRYLDPETASASLELARGLHRALISAGGLSDRGVKRRDDLTGLNWSTVPTAVVELGYLSSPADERCLMDAAWQDRVARALAGAASEFAVRSQNVR